MHQVLAQIVGRDELCQRFYRIAGVGPVMALSAKAAIDDPRRFVKSKTVGAHFGLFEGMKKTKEMLVLAMSFGVDMSSGWHEFAISIINGVDASRALERVSWEPLQSSTWQN